MPQPSESVADARRAVTEPQEETNARAEAGLVAALDRRPAPSAAITQLCAEIRRAIRERRPPDEDSLMRTNPAQEARQAGGQVQSSVNNDANNVRAGYDQMDQAPPTTPGQQGQATASPLSRVNTPSPNAARATPDAVPAEQVSLNGDRDASAQRIGEAGMDSPAAQQVQGGPVAEARGAQGELEQMAAQDPAQVLAEQQAARAQARADMSTLERQALAAMQAGRSTAVTQQTEATGQVELSEEQQRQQASTLARNTFQSASTQVEVLLEPLPRIAMAMWDTGLELLSTDFEDELGRVERWKRERYDQIGGSVLELWDEWTGMPDWVTDLYDRAEREFGDGVCALLTRISERVNGVVAACEVIVAQANRDIAAIFTALPGNLQEWAQAQQAQFQEQLDGLSERVTSARDDLTNDLADRGRGAVQEVRERIHELRLAAGGLLGRIQAAIAQFLEDPARFIINGLLELVGIAANAFWALVNKIGSVISDIADDPLGFANNLARAIGQGFQRFFDNFGTHMLGGFFDWLFSGLGAVGVNIPNDFSPSSIITFFMELMGITWDRIRALLVRLLGERNMELIEQAYELISNLIAMGPGGLFEMIKERFNPREMIQQVIQAGVEFLVETLITRVSARLIMMFNPAGIIIQAIEVIYRILEWIFNNAARIFSLVETIVNGAAALIAGNTAGMAIAVEGALVRLIAPVIDFLAGFMGLGNLPDRIADTIRGFQDWLWGIIERVIRVLADRARALMESASAFASETSDSVRGWWQQRVGFRGEDGENHNLYFRGDGPQAELMVASTPQTFYSWLTGLNPDDDTDKNEALRLYRTLNEEQRNSSTGSSGSSARRGSSGSRAPNSDRISQLTNQLSTVSARLMGGAGVPAPEYGGLTAGGFGTSAVVNNLNSNIPPGSGPSVSNAHWEKLRLRKDGRPDGRTYYIRGHLLNDNIGGPGHSWANLTPITQRANNPNMLNNFERPVKTAVRAGKQVNFGVRAVYGHSLNRTLLSQIQSFGDPLPHILTVRELIIRAEQYLPRQLNCTATEVGGSTIANYRVDNTIEESSLDDYAVSGAGYNANAEYNDLVNAAQATGGNVTWTDFQRGKTGRINYLDSVRAGFRAEIQSIIQGLWNGRRGERIYQGELESIRRVTSVMTWPAFRGSRVAYQTGTTAPITAAQHTQLRAAFDAKMTALRPPPSTD